MPHSTQPDAYRLSLSAEGFQLHGHPFQIRSGEIHFSRVPRAYWRHRLLAAKAMGLNTVCAYLFWNVHEPQPGRFNFKGEADVAAFVRLASEVGLYVILRPGPYACAEWDFGGLPPWLLKTLDIRLRCSDSRFVQAAKRYLLRIGKELAPLQSIYGGPIILVQVENEYGSYGDDSLYMETLQKVLKKSGFQVPLFTCDGPEVLLRGSTPGAFPVANFGSDAENHLQTLRAFSPHTPPACGEYYPGWFDHWGRPHQNKSIEHLLHEMEILMDKAAMFSIYMFHGGTSFGYTAGANVNENGDYMPQTTSYDYDAPLDEAGTPTPKYHALRELINRKLEERGTPFSLPEIPSVPARSPLPSIRLQESVSLFEALKGVQPIPDIQPRNMEVYGQNHGFILYRSQLPKGPASTLTPREVKDYALVFANQKLIGTLDRRLKERSLKVEKRKESQQLDILVEAMGRVNYGPHMLDRKGITERVEFPSPYLAGILMGWEVFPLPMDASFRKKLVYQNIAVKGPAFHRGYFEVITPADTFLDMRGWQKGCVWINGHHLGRYWSIGPQQTLYLPGCWLKKGKNEIVIFDLYSVQRKAIRGLKKPVLDQLNLA